MIRDTCKTEYNTQVQIQRTRHRYANRADRFKIGNNRYKQGTTDMFKTEKTHFTSE